MKEEIRTNQAKVDANLREMKEEMMARLEAIIEANHERMEALMDVSLESVKACLEKTEANQTKVEIKMEACLKEMKRETFGAPKKRYRDRHLAIGRHRQPKKQTQGDGGSQKKLAAACR
jgi:hypothetical protein